MWSPLPQMFGSFMSPVFYEGLAYSYSVPSACTTIHTMYIYVHTHTHVHVHTPCTTCATVHTDDDYTHTHLNAEVE